MAAPVLQRDWSRPDIYSYQWYKHLRTLGSRSQGELPELDLFLKRRGCGTEHKVLKKHGVYQGAKQVFFPGEYMVHQEMLKSAQRCPQIVRMSDFWITESGIRSCLEFEFCEGLDAHTLFLQAREAEKPLALSLVLHIMAHMLLAIVYLETGSCFDFEARRFDADMSNWIPIVHREICLKNIYFRFVDTSGDDLPLPEPVLGNFRHAIPAASHYQHFLERYQHQERIVDNRMQPVLIDYTTFNKRLYIDPAILPPDSVESEPEIDEWARAGDTNKTPAQHLSTNLYQLGAAICALVTGEPWAADDKNLPLAHDKEFLKRRLNAAGLSKAMAGILAKITDPNPRSRGDIRGVKALVSTIIKTRDAQWARDSVDGRLHEHFFVFPFMPKGGKQPAMRFYGDERQSRRSSSSGSSRAARSSSPIREAISTVKNYVRSHSPVRRSSFSRSDYRRGNQPPFGGDQRPAPRSLY